MAGENSPTAQTNTGTNGFFGNVLTGLGEAVKSVASNVIPVWAAKEMGLQWNDQLRTATFDPEGTPAPQKLDAIQGAQGSAGAPLLSRTLFDIGGIQVTGSGLLVAGGVFLLTLVVLKKVV